MILKVQFKQVIMRKMQQQKECVRVNSRHMYPSVGGKNVHPLSGRMAQAIVGSIMTDHTNL